MRFNNFQKTCFGMSLLVLNFSVMCCPLSSFAEEEVKETAKNDLKQKSQKLSSKKSSNKVSGQSKTENTSASSSEEESDSESKVKGIKKASEQTIKTFSTSSEKIFEDKNLKVSQKKQIISDPWVGGFDTSLFVKYEVLISNLSSHPVDLDGKVFKRLSNEKANAILKKAMQEAASAGMPPVPLPMGGFGIPIGLRISPKKGVRLAVPLEVAGIKTMHTQAKIRKIINSSIDSNQLVFSIPAGESQLVQFLSPVAKKDDVPILAISYKASGSKGIISSGIENKDAETLLNDTNAEKKSFLEGKLNSQMAGIYFSNSSPEEAKPLVEFIQPNLDQLTEKTEEKNDPKKKPQAKSVSIELPGTAAVVNVPAQDVKFYLFQNINQSPDSAFLYPLKLTKTKTSRSLQPMSSSPIALKKKEVKAGCIELTPSTKLKPGNYAFRTADKAVYDFTLQ